MSTEPPTMPAPADGPATLGADLSRHARQAFRDAFPEVAVAADAVAVVAASHPDFGDYQCNAAMGLARVLRQPPRAIAAAVAPRLAALPELARCDVAGPGFLNLVLADDALTRRLEAQAADPGLGIPALGAGRTVVMDYGSPNMTKPLHIGHLRSHNIGSAIDRMHRALGYRVLADNHLGDWGTQFGVTIMGYRHFGDPAAMRERPLEELERVYVKSYERARDDAAWMEQCRAELVKLQQGDAANMDLWRQFMAWSMAELNRIYDRLGIRYDMVRGESYYRDRLAGTVEDLVARGLARASEGATVVFLDDAQLPVCIVRKSDGGYNYAANDLATVAHRVEEFEPDRIVYVTDERQQLHFRQVFAICRRLGYRVGLDHVWFGLMRLPDATFSTRQGNVIKLETLLDEAEARAREIVRRSAADLSPDAAAAVARAVGIGAVKYADLSQNPQSVVTFTWDKALALDGNSGPYLQYAYARIAGVRRKYDERHPGTDPDRAALRLVEPVERRLAVTLLRFPDTLAQAAHQFRPNVLADYLYEMAQTYSTFYQNVPFLKAEPGLRDSRVRLSGMTARVLRAGLELLGIETPERI